MPEFEDSPSKDLNVENSNIGSTNDFAEGILSENDDSNAQERNSVDGYKKRSNNKTRRYALKRGKIPQAKDVLHVNNHAGVASVSDVENDAISRVNIQQHDFDHVKKTTKVVGEENESQKLITTRISDRGTSRRVINRHKNLVNANRKPRNRNLGFFQRIKNLFASIFRRKRSDITASNQRTTKAKYTGSRSGSTHKKRFHRTVK
jgi:hypothetical protein